MQREIINQQPGSGFKRGDLVAQDGEAVLVRPVVEDVAEVVDVCAAHGLGRG